MRIDTVVVGMDFSPVSISVATWVARSLAPNAKLALVHAIEPPPRPSFLVAETLPAEVLETDARANAMASLREVAGRFGPDVVRLEVRTGRAADVVRQFAIDADADLVVVGPHGNRAHRSRLLGTTADNLVRGTPVPVLIGPRAPLNEQTRVIAGVVDTPIAERVLMWGDFAARRLGGRLTTLFAVEPAAYAHMASLVAARSHGDVVAEKRELDAERRQLAQHWLATSSRARVNQAIVDVVVEEGLASDVILRYAEDEQAALIVLGGHENAAGLPPRLGSTVRRLLHEARCAVLIVPLA